MVILKNMGVDTKMTLLGALEVIHTKTFDSVDVMGKWLQRDARSQTGYCVM